MCIYVIIIHFQHCNRTVSYFSSHFKSFMLLCMVEISSEILKGEF